MREASYGIGIHSLAQARGRLRRSCYPNRCGDQGLHTVLIRGPANNKPKACGSGFGNLGASRVLEAASNLAARLARGGDCDRPGYFEKPITRRVSSCVWSVPLPRSAPIAGPGHLTALEWGVGYKGCKFQPSPEPSHIAKNSPLGHEELK